MLTILIACDHKQSREALTRLLSAQPFFTILVCADTHAAIAIASHHQPNIVLIDGGSDPLAAIEATKKIVACSTANVIALSHQSEPMFARHIMAAGALGYLTGHSPAAQIIMAVNEVAKDNTYSCLDNMSMPLSTTVRESSLKKSIASIRNNTRKKIAETAEVHWHGILKFTN